MPTIHNMQESEATSSNPAAIDILGRHASLSLADVGLCPLFDPDGLDLDEAGGVSGLESTELVHGGLPRVVQTLQTNQLMLSRGV